MERKAKFSSQKVTEWLKPHWTAAGITFTVCLWPLVRFSPQLFLLVTFYKSDIWSVWYFLYDHISVCMPNVLGAVRSIFYCLDILLTNILTPGATVSMCVVFPKRQLSLAGSRDLVSRCIYGHRHLIQLLCCRALASPAGTRPLYAAFPPPPPPPTPGRKDLGWAGSRDRYFNRTAGPPISS
jgi:hypothetical protein